LIAVRAAESKKASEFVVLDLRPVTSFTDYFVICEGSNPKQVQAIADEIHFEVKKQTAELPISFEGYTNGEWVLMDYGDFLVHVFHPEARKFYDLERLWSGATPVAIPAEQPTSSAEPLSSPAPMA
jgi:ribosome-associated protein